MISDKTRDSRFMLWAARAALLSVLSFIATPSPSYAVDKPTVSAKVMSETTAKVSWAVPRTVSVKGGTLILQRAASGARFSNLAEYSSPKRKGSHMDQPPGADVYRYRVRMTKPVRTPWSKPFTMDMTGDEGNSPTPTPTPTATRTPTPTPTPSSGSGNAAAGKSFFQSACSSCHGKKSGNASFVQGSLNSRSDHQAVKGLVNSTTLANIVAYFNSNL